MDNSGPYLIKYMVWKLVRNLMELIIYVEPSFMQVCAPSSSHAYCIFAQITNKNDFIKLYTRKTEQ